MQIRYYFPLTYSFFLLILTFGTAKAQDQQFTQFYGSPQTLNPALAGAFEGKYRVGAIYRDQWRGILDNPIKTYAVAADLRFRVKKRSTNEDAIGLGVLFYNDKISVIDFNTTQIGLSFAYHKALGNKNKQFLSLGIQGGLTQRNLNYESLQFHDEFDGSTGYVNPTGEPLPDNTFAYTDYNVGLNYTARIGRSGNLFAGAAIHHFLRPIVSFNRTEADADKLYPRYSAQVSANLPVGSSNRFAVLPRFLIAFQGPHMQINTGTNFRVAMGKYGTTALHFGSWLRPVRTESAIGLDAVVALVGLEYNSVLFGLSYDLNLQALKASQRQGALELSVVYLGDYDNEEILCPKF